MNQKVCIQRTCISLIFSVLYLLSFAQTRQISGIVKDVSGEPVIGVNVSVKGTGNGSITDLDGKFTIPDVKEKDVLVVSYIGYLTQSVSVGKKTSFIITLKEDTQALDEVVVVGYGVQKKRDLSGAISSVKSRDITAIPTTNALEALQGKVAGLDLTASSGKAGADLSFTIRGERSLKASNAPLILVDGIDYGTTLDINPSDIESIEVLKDASSTAIYGTRGANGIIIVTTKKGKAGKVILGLVATAAAVAGLLVVGNKTGVLKNIGKYIPASIKDASWLQAAKEPVKKAVAGMDKAGGAIAEYAVKGYEAVKGYGEAAIDTVKGWFGKGTPKITMDKPVA